MIKREYVPYGFDWRGDEGPPYDTAHCTGCEEDFNTNHEIRQVDGELVQYFSHMCPRCDTLDKVFGVSSPTEVMTLRE